MRIKTSSVKANGVRFFDDKDNEIFLPITSITLDMRSQQINKITMELEFFGIDLQTIQPDCQIEIKNDEQSK